MPSLEEKFSYLNNFELQQALYTACSKNLVEEVKYLMSSSYKKRLDLSKDDDLAIRCAVGYGSIEVVKYLLSEPTLKEQINLHAKNDIGVKMAAKLGKNEMLEYLILEVQIPKTEAIEKFLSKNSNKVVESLFRFRELTQQLSFDFQEPSPRPKM